MKAVQINNYGSSDELVVNESAPEPQLKEGQVLVEVMGTTINPFDRTVMQGVMKETMPLEMPATLGGDFSGKVIKVYGEETTFKVGDEVFGQAILFNGGSGSFAELVASNVKNMALKPESLDFASAGVLPLVGASAIQAITEHIAIKPGQKILIHGGAGGIGHIALQLAKACGAYVATTVRFDDKEFARKLGADEIIDYKNDIFEEILRDFDAVFDTVGGEVTTRSLKVLKKGGTIVSMKGIPDPQAAADFNVQAVGQMTITNTERLSMLTRFIEDGKIKVNVSKVFELSQIKEAFSFFEKEHFTGKLSIKVK